jgi:chemotaxis protein MotB
MHMRPIQAACWRVQSLGQAEVAQMGTQTHSVSGIGAGQQKPAAGRQVEISEDGQRLPLQVAPTLLRLPKLVFQVAGHTDDARVVSAELRGRYPTNWELSTARATNVVRFLQERGRVPGDRLVAAGFAKYRPVASNRTEPERAKNRRIEITLVQRP